MQVFVLMGYFDYEGEYLLGVYTSSEAAEAAYAEYLEDHDPFDDYAVVERTLDTAAEWFL